MFTAQFFMWPCFSIRRLIRFFLISACVCLIVVSWGTKTLSQIPSLGEGSSTAITLPPRNVNRYGTLEVTWVESPISGKKLFQVAFPTVLDRSDLNRSQMSVEIRAKNIEDLIRLEITRFRENAISRLFIKAQGGDIITANGETGLVEKLNLRLTQIRSFV